MLNLLIPDGEEEVLQAVAKLNESDYTAFSRALDAAPTPGKSGEYKASVAERMSDTPAVPSEALVDSLLELRIAVAKHGWDIPEVAEDLGSKLLTAGIISTEEAKLFEGRLRELLNSRNLGIVADAKAFIGPDVIKSTVISTELKPYFRETEEEHQLVGFSIHHELAIRTVGSNKVLHWRLDSDELHSIQRQIVKALNQGLVLEKFAKAAGEMEINDADDDRAEI